MGKKGKSICLFSSKGGTGKSSIATLLSGFFAMQEKKVLIIDFDLSFGSIGLLLNKESNKNIYDLYSDYSNNKFSDISDYVTKYNDNILFLASSSDPRQGVKINDAFIKFILEKSIYTYDYIIIDTNSDCSNVNIDLLDNVDNVLFIMNNDLLNIKNMRSMINIFKVAGKTNYKVLLNESTNPYKNYYSLYDIKKMIGTGVDYNLTSKFFMKNYDSLVFDGSIITLDKKFSKYYPKANKVFMSIYNDMEENNE